MDTNPFAPDFAALPEILPVFPLNGVLLLPNGHLPLNIFEPRYKKMIEAVMARDRIIGMVQAKSTYGDKPPLFDIGCAGKITQFEETSDGRYLITLVGLCRFKIDEELKAMTLYRQIRPGWDAFERDLEKSADLNIDRVRLMTLLKTYFSNHDMTCDWDAIDGAPDSRLITCLAMICPFESQEKQALLEAPCVQTRAEMFMAMLNMATHGGCGPCH